MTDHNHCTKQNFSRRNLINKVTLGELSNYGPCLTTFNGSLGLVWFGTDGQFNLLLSGDGINWSNKQTVAFAVGDKNNVGPPPWKLAAPSRTQIKPWRGETLIIMPCVPPLIFPKPWAEVLKPANTQITPPACLRNTSRGLDRVIQQLNIAVAGGPNFSGPIVGKIVSSESSDGGSCLCDFNGETLIGWRGSGNNTLNVAQVSSGNIVNKKVVAEYSDYGPACRCRKQSLYGLDRKR